MNVNADTPFKASNIKLERARVHIAELERVFAQNAIDNPPTAIWTEPTETENGHLHVHTFGPPEEVGAIIGDVIHNLRAALDLMAVRMVEASGGNTKGVYFPFCDSRDDLGKIIKKRNFDRAGFDAVQLLRSLKPFKGGNAMLRALHDLDIQDKHHSLIPNAVTLTSPPATVDMSSGSPKIKFLLDQVPPVVHTFPDDSPLAGQELLPALHKLVELVEGILQSFATLIRAPVVRQDKK